MRYKTSICWLRRDLRIHDHRVLKAACEESEEVICAFVFDSDILKGLEATDRRMTFIHQCVQELHAELKAYGSHLVVLHGKATVEIPKLAESTGASAVFVGTDYEPSAKERDQRVASRLQTQGRAVHLIKDHVVFEGREILTGQGSLFRVFTPYKNMWLKSLRATDIAEAKPDFSKLSRRKDLSKLSRDGTLSSLGFKKVPVMFEGGSKSAKKSLKDFSKKLHDYQKTRDFPAKDGTSHLSVHFRFGTLSIREAVRLTYQQRTLGSKTWLNELIWRDFYQMILDQFPHSATESFRPEYNALKWTGSPKHFEVWKTGQTGYPLIDAAMRHFSKTGWMHNRLRMIVAMFLTKDLLIDWKKGERYFASLLLDYDMAANVGGWQWSASTGCDAQPYFRIFNPITQSEKFDPQGDFIREHVRELRNYDAKWIHFPSRAPFELQKKWSCQVGKDYPSPIVDHSVQREKALEMFKRIK